MKDRELQQNRRVVRKRARVKVVRIETRRLGLLGRVVVGIIGVLALGAAFFFSVLMFSMVIVIAMIGLLYALLGSRNVKSGEDQVIEGERVFEEENKNDTHEHRLHRD